MAVLLLRLSAPLQSWGCGSFLESDRNTMAEPTKSGVIGLLAAALGRDRMADIQDLVALKFGVRVDQPGTRIRDFHIAHVLGQKNPNVTKRYYLQDAAFLVGLESDDMQFLMILESALRNPIYPLFLGRKSCPPTNPLYLGIRDGSLRDVLRSEPWISSDFWRKSAEKDQSLYQLRICMDCSPNIKHSYAQCDVPVSFDSNYRQHTWRNIETEMLDIRDVDDIDVNNKDDTDFDVFGVLDANDTVSMYNSETEHDCMNLVELE